MSEQDIESLDPLIKDVVIALNAAGHTTCSSCQGQTCAEDVQKNCHTQHAFVTFGDPDVLKQRKAKLKAAKLYIYNGGYSVTPLSGRESDIQTIFKRNRKFSDKLREVFDLGEQA